MGNLSVYTGVMGAGKTAILITTSKNLTYNGNKVYHIKPKADTRDGNKIKSRNITDEIEADLVLDEFDDVPLTTIIMNGIQYVIVDECQFLTERQVSQLIELSAKTDINILLYGIKISWRGTVFPSMALAIAMADPNEVHTIVSKLDNKHLTHHIKLVDGVPVDITEDDKIVECGDLDSDVPKPTVVYKPVTKEKFYSIYPNHTNVIYSAPNKSKQIDTTKSEQ